MKKCVSCGNIKDETNFYKRNCASDGLRSSCISCRKKQAAEYKRSPEGIISKMWSTQKSCSEKRGHLPPDYSKDWLRDFVLNHKDFRKIYEKYVSSGFDSDFRPSIDRIDNSKGYTKDNIRLLNWAENNKLGWKSCKKSVLKLTPNGDVVEKYNSLTEAAMSVPSGAISAISRCCHGGLKTHKGFAWKMVLDE